MVNPVRGPIDVLRLSSAYPWSLTVLFEGQHIAAANLPARYIFVWFLNTLPEVFIAALFIGTLLVVFRVISRPKLVFSCDSLPLLVLLVSIAFPIASIIIKRSVIYDAVRHLLFVVPPLAVLGGVALDRLLKDIERGRLALVLKGGVYVLLSLGLGVVAFDMYLLHPYQYVYFNRLVMGGLPKAYGQFETEYWATCFKESVEWVRENRGSTSSAVKVAGWSDPLQLTWYLSSDESRRNGLVYTADESDADIYIATSRWNAHYRSYKLIHTIDRQGVPLCFIFDRRGF
jgi:hypothetical protein